MDKLLNAINELTPEEIALAFIQLNLHEKRIEEFAARQQKEEAKEIAELEYFQRILPPAVAHCMSVWFTFFNELNIHSTKGDAGDVMEKLDEELHGDWSLVVKMRVVATMCEKVSLSAAHRVNSYLSMAWPMLEEKLQSKNRSVIEVINSKEDEFTNEVFSCARFYFREKNDLENMDNNQFAVMKGHIIEECKAYEAHSYDELLKLKQKDPIFKALYGNNLEGYLQNIALQADLTDIELSKLEKKLLAIRELKLGLLEKDSKPDSAKCLDFYFNLQKHKKLFGAHRDSFGKWFMELMEKLFKRSFGKTRGSKFVERSEKLFKPALIEHDKKVETELESLVPKPKKLN